MRSRSRSSTLPVGVLAFLIVVLAGCGGGDDTATAPATISTEPLTKAELTSRANEICTGVVQDIEAIGAPPNLDPQTLTPDTIRGFSDFYGQSADAGEDGVASLSGLTPPQAVAKSWGRFLKLYEQVMVDFQRQLADAADSGEKSTFFKAAFRGQTAVRDLNAVSGGLGLDACGTGSASG